MVAEASPHSAQVEKYLWLSEQGWKAYQAEKREAATMILLHKGKRYAPLYSDGSFDPPVEVKRKVRIDWHGPRRPHRPTSNTKPFRICRRARENPEQPDAINCNFPLPPARPELR